MLESRVPPDRQYSRTRSAVSKAQLLEFPATGRPLLPFPPMVDPAPAPPASSGWKPMELGQYRVTIAQTLAEREAACRLRFKVFNIELREGLQSSYRIGLDTDDFDLFCDHLVVEDRNSRAIVGTYRMQTGRWPPSTSAITPSRNSISVPMNRYGPEPWSSDAPRSTANTAPARS
jgi:hypothetical protein